MKKKHATLGILSILAGLLVAFVLTPIYNNILKKQETVVRVKKTIAKGEIITEEKIETLSVGSYNLSSEVIKDKDKIVGKFAKTDYFKGNYITEDGISTTPIEEDIYLNDLQDGKYAISITVPSFAAGLSSKLLKGDIVSLIVKKGDGDVEITEIPDSLSYVEVLATTEESGEDKEKNEIEKEDEKKNEKLATITLLVNKMQAEELASYEEKGIHIALKTRNNKKLKEKLLEQQEKILKELEGETKKIKEIGTVSFHENKENTE